MVFVRRKGCVLYDTKIFTLDFVEYKKTNMVCGLNEKNWIKERIECEIDKFH